MSTIELPIHASDSPDHSGPIEEGRALSLSGGGYRAMLFHLGALWRLNDLGMLQGLKRISSVSGGSITSAVLGLAWSKLAFAGGSAANFAELVVVPVRKLAGKTIDEGAIIKGALLPGSINERFAAALRKQLYGEATLQDLPDAPRFVINATNMQTGKLWRFSRPYMGDWTIGRVMSPRFALADAVAASAAFPPVLSPAVLKLKASDYFPGDTGENRKPEFMSQVVLADGGVYDNLGLETCFKRYRTLLVSDAGMRPEAEAKLAKDPVRQTVRVLEVADSQVRALRKRQLLGTYVAAERKGAYWSSTSDVANYPAKTQLSCPVDRTKQLAVVPTRLKKLPGELQDRLINWGYAICDTAVRSWVDSSLPAATKFPCAGGV